MPPIESWVIDSLPLTSGSFTLMELVADPPRARRDWISAADSETAALMRQSLHENRTITMKLRVSPTASMDTALDRVGALIDKLRAASAVADGIALVWTPAGSTRARTFDVLAGEITGLPISLSGDGYSWVLGCPIITVELTCKPYWRGTETLTSTASSSTPFVTLEIAGVTGDVPALTRLIITDTASQSRRHVEWGLEGPLTYNSGTSLLVDSDNMVTSGFSGAQTTKTGAYDPNAAGNSTINISQLLTVPQAVCGTGDLSHIGSFRVKARVFVDVTSAEVRLAWQVGDGPITRTDWASPPAGGFWSEVDLGTITVPAVLSGTQRWTGQIEAQDTTVGSGNFYVDYLTLVPTSDGYGKARASYTYATGVIVGRDSFTSTTAGVALNARVAPAGGTWATSGDATDFAFADDLSDEQAKRSVTGTETSGRFGILGASNYTDVQVESRITSKGNPGFGPKYRAGVIARWADASNHVRAYLEVSVGAVLVLEQVVAGVATVLNSVSIGSWAANRANVLRLIVFTSGHAIAQALSTAGALYGTVETTGTVFATGGTLQTGKPGIYDRNVISTGTGDRYYDDFTVSTPAPEPITLYSGRNMQVRYDDVFRQDSTGTYTGRPASYRGGRILLPPGTSRVLVKARRNDVDASNDENVTDATQIQIGWTPRGLAVPR